jgi:hypothetical protein
VPLAPTYEEKIWRAVIEASYILFLFYADLLMGEFERTGMAEEGLSLGDQRHFHRRQFWHRHDRGGYWVCPF